MIDGNLNTENLPVIFGLLHYCGDLVSSFGCVDLSHEFFKGMVVNQIFFHYLKYKIIVLHVGIMGCYEGHSK